MFCKLSAVTFFAFTSLFVFAEAKRSPFPSSPEASIQYIFSELSANNGEVLWEALPTSYQADIVGVAALICSKTDAETYDRSFRLLGRLANLIDKKSDFIANSIAGAGAGEDPERMKEGLSYLSELLDKLSNSLLATHASLREFDGEAVFRSVGSAGMAFVNSVALLEESDESFSLDELSSLKVEVLKEEQATAVLRIIYTDDVSMEETFVLVEGRWVPELMAAQWSAGISGIRSELAAITDEQVETSKLQSAMVFGIVESLLSQIESAETQESFDFVLKSAAMPLMSLLMMSGQTSGFTLPGADLMPVPEPHESISEE